MALSANTVFEVRTTGSDTNGGGFVTGASGTDWSQQASAQYSVTDAVTAGTTTITSASASFGTDVVGNILYIQGGTAGITAGWYQITARASATSITVDRSTGLTAGTGATLNIGGAFLTLATPESIMVTGNVCWVKSGTYTISASFTFNCGSALPNAAPTYFLGYDATRGDQPTGTGRPLIDTASALNPMVRVSVGPRVFSNFRLDGADTAVNGIVLGDGTNIRGAQIANCKVERCTTRGIVATQGSFFGPVVGCEVTDLTAGATSAIQGGLCVGCYVHDSPGSGYEYPISAVGCVADTMTADGFKIGEIHNSGHVINCVSYGNGGDGFDATATYSAVGAIMNNIIVNNGGYGIRTDKTEQIARNWLFDYNAFYNNTSGDRLNYVAGNHDITLTGDPFTDAPNGDFSLNNTAGAGADLKGTGFPTTFPAT